MPTHFPNHLHRSAPADWLIPQWPAPPNVRAVCTTRAGGVSDAPYASLNLGSHVGDDPVAVGQNRGRLAAVLEARPVFLNQVHGTHMLAAQSDSGDGQDADGAFTPDTAIACTVMVADCLPILLCDTHGTVVAAVHAGWRGLAGVDGQGVVEAAYKQIMPFALAGRAEATIELIAWLGPCIGPDAFEVGPEVRATLVANAPQAADCFAPLPSGKWLANLPGLARQHLQALGVMQVYGNDGSAPWCTVGNPSRFFSYRRDGVCGRMAACIWRV